MAVSLTTYLRIQYPWPQCWRWHSPLPLVLPICTSRYRGLRGSQQLHTEISSQEIFWSRKTCHVSSQIWVYVSNYLRMVKLIYLKIIKWEPNVTWLRNCLMKALMKVSLTVGGEPMSTVLVLSFGSWPAELNLDKAWSLT